MESPEFDRSRVASESIIVETIQVNAENSILFDVKCGLNYT